MRGVLLTCRNDKFQNFLQWKGFYLLELCVCVCFCDSENGLALAILQKMNRFFSFNRFISVSQKRLTECFNCFTVRLACGRVLEECLSLNNREYVVNKGYLKKLVATAEKLNKNPEQQRMSLSIMESLFKHSTATTYRYVKRGRDRWKMAIISSNIQLLSNIQHVLSG